MTMRELVFVEALLAPLRVNFLKWFPALALQWRNGIFFESLWTRACACMALTGLAAMCVIAAANLLTLTGAYVGQENKRSELAQDVGALKRQALLLQSEHATRHAVLQNNQSVLHELAEKSGDLLVHWPNSALRMPLLSQLQGLAVQRDLQLVKMQALTLPDEMGFESSAVRFHLKGTQMATYGYWQTLNHVFSNGSWKRLSWELGPDGLFSFEAQLNLWWDSQDAYTDTGVAVRWNDALTQAPRVTAPTQAAESMSHAFPNQSHAQMRMVGFAQSDTDKPPHISRAWALVKSGHQILPVHTGQLVGIEKLRVQWVDAQGLWLATQSGHPQTLVMWEAPKP